MTEEDDSGRLQCMICGGMFISKGPHHKICIDCRTDYRIWPPAMSQEEKDAWRMWFVSKEGKLR